MKRLIHLLPRVLLIFLISFFIVMSMDVFSMPGTTLEKVIGFSIHSFPALLLLIPLFISNKRPQTAGIMCILLAFVRIFFFHTYKHLIPFLIISVPPFVIGHIFMIEGREP